MNSERAKAQAPSFQAGDTATLTMCYPGAGSAVGSDTIRSLSTLLAVDCAPGDTLYWNNITSVSGGSLSGSFPTYATTGVGEHLSIIFTSTTNNESIRFFKIRVHNPAGLADTIVVRVNEWIRPVSAPITGLYNEVHEGDTIYFSNASAGGSWLIQSGTRTGIDASGTLAYSAGPVGLDNVVYRKSNVCYTTDSLHPVTFLRGTAPGSSPTVPTPSAIDTAWGIPATSFTFSGTDFNATPSRNIVYFGGVKANVTGGSATSLTVDVPYGTTYNRISVTDDSTHLTGFTRHPYTPTYNNCAFNPSTYLNLQPYDSIILRGGIGAGSNGARPYSIEMADIDGDGKLDMATCGTDTVSGEVTVFRNISTPGTVNHTSFSSPIHIRNGIPDTTYSRMLINLKFADLDADGKPDLMAASPSTARVYIFRNTSTPGSISFDTAFFVSVANLTGAGGFRIGTGALPSELSIADYNNDGRTDIGVVSVGTIRGSDGATASFNGALTVIRNNYNKRKPGGALLNAGDFAVKTIMAYDTTTSKPLSLCSGDFNGDGKMDIAVADHYGRNVKIFQNNTTGHSIAFAAPTTINTGVTLGTADFWGNFKAGYPNQIRCADFNRDGYQELIVAVSDSDLLVNNRYNFLNVYSNSGASGGTISFGGLVQLATGIGPVGIAVGDMTGDHALDIVVTNSGAGSVSIIKNTSSGGAVSAATFTTKTDFVIERFVASAPANSTGIFGGPVSVVMGDIDNNTIADFAVVSREANLLSIVQNAPVPVVSAITGTGAGSDTVCVGSPLTLKAGRLNCTSGSGAWSHTNSTLGSITFTSGSIADTMATLNTTGIGVDTVYYDVTSLNNTARVMRIVHIVDTAHAGSISGPTSVCVGSTIALTNTGGNGSWSTSASTIASITSSTISNANVLGVAAGSATISYTATAPSCPNRVATYGITVNALPNADTIHGTLTPCTSSSTTYTVGSGAFGTGSWSVGTSTIASIDAGGVLHTGTSSGTVIITYTASTVSCGTVSSNLTVTVTNTSAPPITGSRTVCQDSTTTLSNTASGGTWSNGGSSVATVDGSGNVTGLAAGTAVITYTLGVCSASDTFTITVNGTATVGPISPATASVCVGSTVTLSNATIGGSWTSSNSTIASVSSGGVVLGRAVGTADITYTVTGLCNTAFTVRTVTVNPAAEAGTISGNSTVCTSTSSNTYTSDSTGGNWFVSNTLASISSGGVLTTGATAGIDTVMYVKTSPFGCASDTAFFPVNIIAVTTPSITGAGRVCAGSTTTLTGSPSAGGSWTISPLAVATIGASSGVVTGVTPGTATVTYTVTNVCGTTTANYTIIVDTLPNAGTITGPDTLCPGVGAGATYTASGDAGTWGVGSTSIASIDVTGFGYGVTTTGGSTTITRTVTSPHGCTTSTATHPLFIRPNAIPGTLSPSGSVICEGDLLSFTTTGQVGGTWSITGGGIDASTGDYTAPSGSGSPFGNTKTVTYTVTNICGPQSATTTVTVRSKPTMPAITGPSTVCANDTITLTCAATVGGGVTSINWGSMEPASLSRVSQTSTSARFRGNIADPSVVVYDSATNMCGSSVVMKTITVNAAPNAGVITGSDTICFGTLSSYVAVGGQHQNGFWDVTGGTSYDSEHDSTVVVQGTGAATGFVCWNEISLTGCGTDTACHTVRVQQLPYAGADHPGVDTICPGTTIVYTADAAGFAKNWVSSDPAVATTSASGFSTDTVFAVAAGNVIIYNIDANFCGTDTALFNLHVNPASPYAGVITGADSLCDGQSTIFRNTTADITAGAGVWSVASGSSTIVSIASSGVDSTIVTGNNAGLGTIRYTVTNSCGSNTATKSIKINAFPVFTSSPTASVCDSIAFNFTPMVDSDMIATYAWIKPLASHITNPADTGVDGFTHYLDNDTSVNQTVVYNYSASAHGCITSSVLTVTVKPTPYLTSTKNVFVCSGEPMVYVDSESVTGTNITWKRPTTIAHLVTVGSDSGTTHTITGTFTSDTLKPVTFPYVIHMNANGCTNNAQISVTVNPRPSFPSLTTHPSSNICAGTMYMNFGSSITPPAGVNYSWSATNAVIWATGTTRQYSLVNFTNPGTSYVYLLATLPGYTCAAKDSFGMVVSNSVSDNPTVIYFNGDFVCLSNTEESYQWGYDDHSTLDSGKFDGETNQNYTNVSPDFNGKYYWVITTKGGCMQKSYYIPPVGIKNVTATMGDIRLYPNPAEQYVNVEVSNTSGGSYDVEVVNMLGQKVATQKMNGLKAVIEVADFAAGVYFVDCYRDGVKFATEKFVKN